MQSTLQRTIGKMKFHEKVLNVAVRKGFDNAWVKIVNDAMEDPDYQDINSSLEWLKEVLQKTVPFGKQIR